MSREAIPKKIKDFLLIASKHQCSICQAHTIDIHHIVPVSQGGSNDLDNLMVVCPNHHREYHQGRFSVEQMKTYRTQWIQKCNIFLEIGLPTEILVKDREIASNLSLDIKLQFLEQYTNCDIQNISVDDDSVTIYFWSAAQSWSEITHDIISFIQTSFRFFKDSKNIRCTCLVNKFEEKYFGKDDPELYSFRVGMKEINDFIFGKIALNDFWDKIEFFKKERPNAYQNEKLIFRMPLRL
jgi:hypothetical protein